VQRQTDETHETEWVADLILGLVVRQPSVCSTRTRNIRTAS
jgi:hypothetical protein